MQEKQSIVIKIGTSSIAHSTGLVNILNMERLIKVISDVKNFGHNIILVSSGAIGIGFGKLGMLERPKDVPSKQAAAAVGQCELMYIYDKMFTEYNHKIAQVLLSADAFQHENVLANIKNTFSKLAQMNTIAIVNENDTVATDEILFGDNDNLSAQVAVLTNSDKLIILSDINGLYDKNPKTNADARLISKVYNITSEITKMASISTSGLGTGGMLTKLQAANFATTNNIDTYIINGNEPNGIYKILENKSVGTHFLKKGEQL